MLNLSRSFYDEAEKMGKKKVCWVKSQDGSGWVRSYNSATIRARKKELEAKSEELLRRWFENNH